MSHKAEQFKQKFEEDLEAELDSFTMYAATYSCNSIESEKDAFFSYISRIIQITAQLQILITLEFTKNSSYRKVTMHFQFDED